MYVDKITFRNGLVLKGHFFVTDAKNIYRGDGLDNFLSIENDEGTEEHLYHKDTIESFDVSEKQYSPLPFDKKEEE